MSKSIATVYHSLTLFYSLLTSVPTQTICYLVSLTCRLYQIKLYYMQSLEITWHYASKIHPCCCIPLNSSFSLLYNSPLSKQTTNCPFLLINIWSNPSLLLLETELQLTFSRKKILLWGWGRGRIQRPNSSCLAHGLAGYMDVY